MGILPELFNVCLRGPKQEPGPDGRVRMGLRGDGWRVPEKSKQPGRFAKKDDGSDYTQEDLDDMSKKELLELAAKVGVEPVAKESAAKLRARLKAMLAEDQENKP